MLLQLKQFSEQPTSQFSSRHKRTFLVKHILNHQETTNDCFAKFSGNTLFLVKKYEIDKTILPNATERPTIARKLEIQVPKEKSRAFHFDSDNKILIQPCKLNSKEPTMHSPHYSIQKQNTRFFLQKTSMKLIAHTNQMSLDCRASVSTRHYSNLSQQLPKIKKCINSNKEIVNKNSNTKGVSDRYAKHNTCGNTKGTQTNCVLGFDEDSFELAGDFRINDYLDRLQNK